MGCTASREVEANMLASDPPAMRQSVDERTEVELVRSAIVPIQTKDGCRGYETIEYWAQPKPGLVYATAPAPPPYPPRSVDPRAHAFAEGEPFASLAQELARRAMRWAGQPAPTHVFIRLMDSGSEGNVSADVLFLVNNKLRSPYHIDPSAERQRTLLKELATLWRAKITRKGAVGKHHPGDIIIQATALKAVPSVKLVGLSWSSHSCDTPGRRALWMEHFMNQGFENLNQSTHPGLSGSPTPTTTNITTTTTTPAVTRPTTVTSLTSVASTSRATPEASPGLRSVSAPNSPALSFVDPNNPDAKVPPRTQRWLESIEPTLLRMLRDILSWPPTKGRVHRLYIWLIHLRGRGPTVCVDLKDGSRVMISDSTLPTHPDPRGLRSKVAAHWSDLCRAGAPGVDHPAFMRLVGTPRGAAVCSQLAAEGIWQESALDHLCAPLLSGAFPAPPPHFSPQPDSRRGAAFATKFRPVAHQMIELARKWPPRGTRIRDIRIIFGADPMRGLAGYTLITGVSDQALDKGPSAAGDHPYVLQERVLLLFAEYWRNAKGEVPAAIVVQVHPSMPGVDIRAMWEEGEEARRGIGVTLHYLWRMFDDVRHSIPSMGAFDAPPPPDTNAYMFVLSNQFQQLAKACVLRALDWAGPGAEAAWVRLTEIEADFVSADVLLLMDGRVTLLHEFNNKTTAQQQLLFSIAKDWQALAAGGPVGSHHPGDIVIKGSLSNDNKVAVTVLGAS
ncbi:hypothetical protein CC85DRAFT_327135 [Cutaneotrichosporon oleaginosum]|uniref:Uncharacterized protein n=1 Tax=Cutaneotrichosporon oleaginosum TaxID=879819 RepID=A0A0J1B781_9TREE|nr:uncharacterized protein CC85DRAFT_327135 [Cutaneotrichosporon oleaginosum]KLT43584.1 hypothetical protein CC85DRAFT_327135 [Cutaneotrichosporon oleaginosum]TXT12747.1 hypothetical protein COLE_03157 [Cutaneotrichosporon oleaginosum]